MESRTGEWKLNWMPGIHSPIQRPISAISTRRPCRHLMRSNCCALPADRWFKWTGSCRKNDPRYIRLQTKTPMFLAGIGNFSDAPDSCNLFLITTSLQNSMDLDDHWPIVLTPEHAREWIDPQTTLEKTKEILLYANQKAGDFIWHTATSIPDTEFPPPGDKHTPLYNINPYTAFRKNNP